MWSDLILLLPAAVALLILVVRRLRPVHVADTPRGRAIVVDGSNVMHWGGAPSIKVLARVIRSLEGQGYAPLVIFDANVGYKLGAGFLGAPAMAARLGLNVAQVVVVDSGVVADEVILDFAQRRQMCVVSNDRFRDWSVRFPLVKARGRMMRGTWKGGNVVWR